MATTPTTNPIPSESPKDLKFNAAKVDEMVNSPEEAYSDRFGNARLTWAGIEAISRETISKLGYILLKSFEDGATISVPSEVLQQESSGDYFRWDGALPKVVPTGSTPENSGGIGKGKWLSVGDATLRTDLNDGFSGIEIEQQKTKNFWPDVHPEARVHRINDRVFSGGATDNDGDITTDRTPENKDWLEIIRYATTNNSQLAVLSTIGQCAILGGSKTSDFNQAGSLGCIGLQGWAINDNTQQIQTAYGAYFEVRRNVGTGNTHGFELDVVNYGSAVSLQPYQIFQDGLTAGAWIASGGEIAATKASAAIAIINNGSTWDKGIIFHSLAIDGTDGVTGSGVAIEMAKGHSVRWMFGSGELGASMSSSVSNAAATQQLTFSDNGMLFRNKNLTTLFQVDVSDNFVNGVEVKPEISGISPSIGAIGSDANLDLKLVPKGNGSVDLRNVVVSPTAGSTYGYATVKINGTAFKIELKNG